MLLEDDVPTASQFKLTKDPKDTKEKEKEREEKINAKFFDDFAPVFEREARFSKKQPVPMLGAFGDEKQKVEAFYDFWYNFDSWRGFEYLDKEVNEGSDRRVSLHFAAVYHRSEFITDFTLTDSFDSHNSI